MKIVYLNGRIITEGRDFEFYTDTNRLIITSRADNRIRITEKDRLVVINTQTDLMSTYTPVIDKGVADPTNIDGGLKDEAFHWEVIPETRDFTYSHRPLPDTL